MAAVINAFAEFEKKAWPFQYRARLHIDELLGGIPSDPNIAESWIRTKMPDASDKQIANMVTETMLDRGITQEQAIAYVNTLKHLNGFKRDKKLGLYIEGRQTKAMLKEAVSIAVATPAVEGEEKKLDQRGWGDTRKYLANYLAEHVFIEERRHYLINHATGEPLHEATGVHQSFPKNARTGQTGIQYTEYCNDVDVILTITTDHPFMTEEFAMILLTGGKNGVGAQRSQGYGTYTVTEWTQLRGPEVTKSYHNKPAAKPKAKAKAEPEDGDE